MNPPPRKLSFMWIWLIIVILGDILISLIKPTPALTNLFTILSSLTASISLFMVFASLKVFDSTKISWLMLFLGVFLYFSGDVIYAFYEVIVGIETPFPSLADVSYLAGYVFFYGGLIYLITGFEKSGLQPVPWRQYRAIGVLAAITLVVVTVFLFIPIISSEDLPFLEKFLDLAYPLGDTILIFLIFIVLRYTATLGKGIFSKPWQYIVGGFVFMGIGDMLFSYYTFNETYKPGNISDIWLNSAYLLIALGASYQRRIIKSL